MIVGVPKEIKTEEYRVGMVPGGVKLLRRGGEGRGGLAQEHDGGLAHHAEFSPCQSRIKHMCNETFVVPVRQPVSEMRQAPFNESLWPINFTS